MKLKKLLLSAMSFASMVSYSQFNYGEALQKSIFFYEAQQSGELPDWNRVSWRGDSAINDGSDVGKDLTGGWYDAGDHVKFGFPMAFSVTALAWGAIEYEDAYIASGQMEILKRNLRYVTDYFIKCHTAPNEFYGQVGNGGLDHAFWGASEVMVMDRPSYKIDTANPGSDLAAETAAALSAVSILFQDDDPAYSATLISHARELYSFADNYRGEYSSSITDAAGFYRSFSSYQDELVWGAAWLHRATGEAAYLTKAESEYSNLQTEGQSSIKSYKFTTSWDDKAYGSYVLLSQLTGKEVYKADAERFLDFWTVGVDGDRVNYSPGGQAHLIQWGSLRYAANTSFLAFIYSDKVIPNSPKASIYHDFAKGQTDYALGDNPINRSYMVGFGNNPANNVHHRGAHGPWANNIGGSPDAASHILYGALAGGPSSANDQFEDDRSDFIANEVACDYNACFTGNLVRLYSEYGGNPLTNFPIIETPSRAEIRSYSGFNSNNDFGSTVKVLLQNRTAWPARVTDKLSYRYFFNISEGVAAGFGIEDYDITLNSVQGASSAEIKVWDATSNIYYMEVSLAGEQIAPIGDPAFRRETQINLRASNGVPYDTSNDWSAQGLSGGDVESVNIPVYDNGVLVFGNEPNGGETPTASFTASIIEGTVPLTVDFDASASSDPNGDALTYSWDFGNGETSSLVSPSVNYIEAGSYLVSLTVSDGVNTSAEITQTISVEEELVEGGTLTGGPFEFIVGDGIADNVLGIGLTGNIGENSQWVITDDANTILGLPGTPETVNFDGVFPGTCFIYHLSFNGEITGLDTNNNISDLEGNYDLSNNIEVVRNQFVDPLVVEGGTLTGGPFEFIVGDGIADNVSGIELTGNIGENSQWVVTDDARNILGLPGSPEVVDFDGADEGTCFIYHLSYNGVISGLEQNTNLSALTGEFDLSNRIDVIRTNNSTGGESCAFDTPTANSLPRLNTEYRNIYILGEGGPNLDNVTIFTINWDADNNQLHQLSMNTDNGSPSWWNDLKGSVHNFNSAQPEITFSGSDFAGLDGSYYATVDDGNFVLVSKTGGFTIYFSKSDTAPECGDVITPPTNTAPVADLTATPNSGTEPLSVVFDASGSTDADGDSLNYTIDYGDGTTGTGAVSTHVYDAGDFIATITVTDGRGGSDTASVNITVSEEVIVINPPTGDCTFDTPIATSLASLNTSYENIYVLGNGGPNLDNVTNFTINWDLNNNGLYQFSIGTNNGQPNWFNDLRGSLTQNFNSPNPGVTISGSGFNGLDGTYYATIDNGNFVLVATSGTYTIYFSKSTTLPDCENSGGPIVDGGTITGGPFEFTVGDGIADNVSGVSLTGNEGTNSQWVITDDANNILGLPPTPEAVDFDGAGEGVCLIWHLSYEDGLTGLAAGNNVSALVGDYDLSNSITVVRNPVITSIVDGGTITGGPFEFTVGDGIVDNVSGVSLTGNEGTNSQWVITDDANNILGLPPTPEVVDFDGAGAGICLIWHLSYEDGLTGLAAGNNVSALVGDYDFSNSITVVRNPVITSIVDGGTITGGPFEFTVGDGIADNVSGVGLTGNEGTNSQWVITDDANNILGLPPTPEAVDFDGAGQGVCLIWHLSYEDGLTGLAAGNNISALVGDYDLSNSITVIRNEIDNGGGGTGGGNSDNVYIDRFTEMRNEIYDPTNGYFSADGSPHHSIETLIVEAPDYGHESTSELYSYWMWLEAMHGRISGDWEPLSEVWEKTEQFIIPTNADQPTNAAYNPSSPAAYAPEFALPSGYPAPLNFSAPVGVDPVSGDLTATYGPDVYQMHWLLDNDNFYGYGNRGDGVSTPSYINTFQRGEEESVYETVPHPSWESFDWGGESGFLPLFTLDANYSEQWRYTSATDADARAVQAMYWALEWTKEQENSFASDLDLDKASKMGDYLRLGMFDKYFKPMGVQSATNGAGSGYDSAHYLMSWYISWGGSADTASPWAFRIGASHCHFGYQNPVAAYALTQVEEMQPISQNGVRDWGVSLQRQMEFYTWLQSVEGGIAGGATNSWNGDYSVYPSGKSTFYDMAFDTNPVYHDPGSGTWFGWQAWSMERVAEYYYISNDPMAKNLMDKWSTWVESEVQLVGDNDFLIPATLEWSGEPDTWNADNPGSNSGLSVTVTNYNVDLGIAASTAKALIYYAAATEKYATLDEGAKNLAQEILDRMWTTYRDDKGCSSPESRGDYSRIFEEEVYVPTGFTGVMGNGEAIDQGVTFLDLRSGYLNDPEYPALLAAYENGTDYTTNYHRTWAQMEIALANAEYGFFFGEDSTAAKSISLDNFDVVTYPNPATDSITVAVTALDGSVTGTNIVVSNLIGQVVGTQIINEGETSTKVDVTSYPSGVYLVSIYVGDSKIKVDKIIVN